MDNLTVSEALLIFYSKYNLDPTGGVDEDFVTIVLFKGVTLYIPNFEARKKIIVKHDIHHLVTGYSALMKGEMETSAWELSTGCMNNWVAFSINTYSMMLGVLLNLQGIWKAWVVGKRTANLYYQKYQVGELLSRKVVDLKMELGFLNDRTNKNELYNFLTFVWILIMGIVFSVMSFVLIPFVLVYSIIIAIKIRRTKS